MVPVVWQLIGADAGHDGAAAEAKPTREPRVIKEEMVEGIVDEKNECYESFGCTAKSVHFIDGHKSP